MEHHCQCLIEPPHRFTPILANSVLVCHSLLYFILWRRQGEPRSSCMPVERLPANSTTAASTEVQPVVRGFGGQQYVNPRKMQIVLSHLLSQPMKSTKEQTLGKLRMCGTAIGLLEAWWLRKLLRRPSLG